MKSALAYAVAKRMAADRIEMRRLRARVRALEACRDTLRAAALKTDCEVWSVPAAVILDALNEADE